MLNRRVYRNGWLISIVGVIILLLTLQSPGGLSQPAVPPAVNGAVVVATSQQLVSLAPNRLPGSAGDVHAGAWVAQQFVAISGSALAASGHAHVLQQAFVARWHDRLISGNNVALELPGATTGSAALPAIVISAPRDMRAGAPSDASATGMLVALAQLSAATTHQRPLIFLSSDASTVGNAGMRWFLAHRHGMQIGAVINIDAPDEAVDHAIWVWMRGRTNAHALDLGRWAATAIRRAGGVPASLPSTAAQLLGLAVPQTFGDQAPVIADSIPAVTISGRPDTPSFGDTHFTSTQLATTGDAVLGLADALDVTQGIPGPTQAIFFAGRQLSAIAMRLLLLLLVLPVVLVGIDAIMRLHRTGIAAWEGVSALGWRLLPWGVAVLIGGILGRAGVLATMSAGAPPLPGDAPFLTRSLLVIVAMVVAGLAVAMVSIPKINRLGLTPAADVAVSLIAVTTVLGVEWVVRPMSLVLLAIPVQAAAASLFASRRWQLVVCAALVVIPLVALSVAVGNQLHRGAVYAAWYLMITTLQGGRGVVGPILGVLGMGCACSVIAIAYRRLTNTPYVPTPALWQTAWERLRAQGAPPR